MEPILRLGNRDGRQRKLDQDGLDESGNRLAHSLAPQVYARRAANSSTVKFRVSCPVETIPPQPQATPINEVTSQLAPRDRPKNWNAIPMPRSPATDATLANFNVLMNELLRTGLHRANFQPWEIEILLDIESCPLRAPAKRKAIRDYQRAVQTALATGAQRPMPFSEFLQRREPSPAPKPKTRAN